MLNNSKAYKILFCMVSTSNEKLKSCFIHLRKEYNQSMSATTKFYRGIKLLFNNRGINWTNKWTPLAVKDGLNALFAQTSMSLYLYQ